MLSVKDAYIEVDRSDTGAGTDFTIPGDDIESVEFSRRINRLKDEGTIVIDNDDGTYSTTSKRLSLGDRLDVYIAPQRAPTEWDEDYSLWGYGGWGGERLWWSAYVVDPKYIRSSPTESALSLKCTDWVFAILSNRIVFDDFEQRDISGHGDAIVETVLGREAPEIDLSNVRDVSTKTSIRADGTNLLEFMIKLARRAHAVMWGYRDRLVFDRIDNVAPEWTVQGSDTTEQTADVGPLEHTFEGGSVKNVIRVDGGTDYALEEEQPNQSAWTTVTESTRATFQVSTRKSEIARVEIWTDPDRTGSKESIEVRLQKDDGGAPIAPGDRDSDIARKQLDYHFLADNGFTTFIIPSHTLPEPNPWVLIETDGPDGQDIGTDGSGNVAYRAHYPFPVSVQVRDGSSISAYSKVEARWEQENITTLDAAKEMAEEGIEHYADPESEVSFPPISQRAHRLDPGEVVTFDFARERLEGDYMVTETSHTFNGSKFDMGVTAAAVETL